MKLFASKTHRREAIALVLALAVALAGAYVALQRYVPFVFEAAALRQWIDQFGVFAPAVFIVASILQVVLAPVPGQITALVGGYLFGPFLGIVYSMIGVIVGSAIAFSITRMYGRPAVERLLHEDAVERFDGFVEAAGLPGLFLFVLIPGLPDDVVCFVGGLTHFRLPTFLAVIAAGRLPAYVLTTYAGGSIARGNLAVAVTLLALVGLFSLAAYEWRDQIREFARRL